MDAAGFLPGFDEGFADARGARVRFFAGGEGPPLLLVHGFGGAAWNFSELAPLLAGRRLVVPDLPGEGASAPPPAPPLRAPPACSRSSSTGRWTWSATRWAGWSHCGLPSGTPRSFAGSFW